jgi:transmembrane sensor
LKNNNQHIITDELLTRYLAGEATEAEMAGIKEWIDSNESNKKRFEDLKLLWETSGSLSDAVVVDVEKAWKKVKSRIESEEQTADPKIKKISPFHPKNMNYLLRVAAIFLVLSGSAYVIFNYQSNDVKLAAIVLTTKENTLSDTLSDGTVIFLNKNSELTYDADFGNKHRNVFLKGEGYFNVNHTSINSFVVHTQHVVIRDIGTAFNVKAYNKEEVEVVVETGSVMMKTTVDSTLLVQGNKATYNKTRSKIIKSVNEDLNTMAYRTKNIIFESTALSKVVELLNELYNTDIVVKSETLKNCKLTAVFKNESIDTILNVLEETFQLKVSRNEKTIDLEGAGCQ